MQPSTLTASSSSTTATIARCDEAFTVAERAIITALVAALVRELRNDTSSTQAA
ncbi:MAG: hypothetical protein Q8O42_14970 [Acidobacteriota bacterium]|nr:hypothetical protein [Acidobacteriota bacterium]